MVHQQEKNDAGGHKCARCDKLFPSAESLKGHILIHIELEDKPFVCGRCGKNFRFRVQLNHHNARLHKTKRKKKCHRCSVCDSLLGNATSLKRHMRVHSGEKPFSCDLCKQAFARKATLSNHYAAIHLRKQGLASKHNAPIHPREQGQKGFACPYCARLLANLESLNGHIMIHTGEKPFPCDLCEKAFRKKWLLRDHETIVHKRNTLVQYKCPKCPKMFVRKAVLSEHLLIHSDVRPFQCAHCDWSFKSQGSLYWHTRLHTGEKSFKCAVCAKAFATPGTLNRHKRIVHSENSQIFPCQHCGKRFSLKQNLKRHEESVHG